MMGALGDLKRRVAAKLAAGYIVGETLDDAVAVARLAAKRGWSTTVCPWNVSGDPFDEVAAHYVAAIEAIRKHDLDSYLSVKAPAIGFDDALFGTMLDAVAGSDIRLHFDALEPEATEKTFAMIEKGRERHPHFGITLPARWRRSLKDAEKALDLGLFVRAVQGQWPCPEGEEREPAVAYRELIDVLAGRASHVAVASHNVPIATAALDRLQAAQTPVSLEQLYGFPLNMTRRAESRGLPVRIYLGYGKAMLPYGLAMVKKRPVIAWWILRDLLRGDRVGV